MMGFMQVITFACDAGVCDRDETNVIIVKVISSS